MNPSQIAQKQPAVGRSIGLFTATSIVVANMIGAGILTTSGLMASRLPGPGWVFFCWILGGLIALSGALSYAELATRLPEQGGEYVYLKKLYHPFFGFLTGWTSFIAGFSVPIAGSALAFVEYMQAGLRISGTDPLILFLKKLAAVLLIGIFTVVHYHGVRLGSRVQNTLTVGKVVTVFGLALAGVVAGGGKWTNLAYHGNTAGGMALGTAMMLVMFSYSGWNASSYIAGEVKEPKRTLPVSLITGTVIVMAVYLAINLFIFRTVPYDQMKESVTVLEKASVMAFGPWMGRLLSFVVAFALLSSLSAYLLIGPRVYYAMALDHLFFPFASRLHPKYRVPGRSILIQGGIAVLMILIGSFEQILVYIGFTLNFFPWLSVLGIWIARKRRIGEADAVRVPGYPWVPAFYLFASLVLMVIAFINRPVESSAAVATVLLGIPCYLLWIRGLEAAGRTQTKS